MADGGATIRIDETLKKRLEAAAEAAGESLDAYVRQALEAFVDDAETDWDEIDRICDETLAKGDGIAWEEFRPRLVAFGRRDRGR